MAIFYDISKKSETGPATTANTGLPSASDRTSTTAEAEQTTQPPGAVAASQIAPTPMDTNTSTSTGTDAQQTPPITSSSVDNITETPKAATAGER